MKGINEIMLLAIVLCTTCSCGTYITASQVNSYVGQSHNTIVQTFGAPSRQMPDGSGGTILVYETSNQG